MARRRAKIEVKAFIGRNKVSVVSNHMVPEAPTSILMAKADLVQRVISSTQRLDNKDEVMSPTNRVISPRYNTVEHAFKQLGNHQNN